MPKRKSKNRSGSVPITLFEKARKLFEKAYFKEAEKICSKALQEKPHRSEILCLFSDICSKLKRPDEAIKYANEAILKDPANPLGYSAMGAALQTKGQLQQAYECYKKANAMLPGDYGIAIAYASLAHQGGYLGESISSLKKLAEKDSGSKEANLLIAACLNEQGHDSEAINIYTRLLHDNMDDSKLLSNLLLTHNYGRLVSPQDYYSLVSKVVADCYSERAVAMTDVISREETKTPRIRLGFISPDFHRHSVPYFFKPVLTALNRDRFEVFCYYNNLRHDDVTAIIRAQAHKFKEIVSLNDRQLAEEILTDRIDILIDLAGHMRGNRLGAMVYRPAPLQITWLGYPNTTGLTEIDYRLVDEITDPIGEQDQYYSETLWRLANSFIVYEGDDALAFQTELPSQLTSEPFTFGCFNNAQKIKTETLVAWSKILKRVPESRLALKSRQMVDAESRNRILSVLKAGGIDASRIAFAPATAAMQDHMKLYNKVDLALDTFPYNGTTTTCEALWMGVPTVCYKGDRHVERVSASLLINAGFSEFVGENVDDYVDIAVRYATDEKDRLSQLRAQGRELMQDSNLCDANGFTRKFESALLSMYEKKTACK
jgi:predicted O-linked N-acetylglucosamine transferase (SPINDLY family)